MASLANFKGLGRELLGINTFGQKCTNAEQREVVELNLECIDGQKPLTIEALVVPEICSIQNAHVELARKKYPHLKGIWFSDVCKEQEELEIDVLIGSDYLWSFQAGSTRRGRAGEPVAVETELGWVLSGLLKMGTDSAGVAQVNFVAQRDIESLERDVQRL